MSFPLASSLRTALAALLQMGTRRLSLIAMALLAALVVAGPVRAQAPIAPLAPGGLSASCPTGFTASGDGQIPVNTATTFTIIAGGGSGGFEQCQSDPFVNTQAVTFSWNVDDSAGGSASYTANGATTSLNASGSKTVTVNSGSTITFKATGYAASLAINGYTVADPASVAPPPIIKSLSRYTGSRSGGDLSNQVIIYGSGFTADSTVFLGQIQRG